MDFSGLKSFAKQYKTLAFEIEKFCHLLENWSKNDPEKEMSLEEVGKCLGIDIGRALILLSQAHSDGLVEPHTYFYCPITRKLIAESGKPIDAPKYIRCPHHLRPQHHASHKECIATLVFRLRRLES